MKTKVLAILLCSAVSVCCFTGCSNEEMDADVSVSISEQNDNTNYETGVNDSQIKYSENGVMRYLFGFRDLSDTDELAYILIYFKE